MKKITLSKFCLFCIFLIVSLRVHTQSQLRNFGDLKVHENGNLGLSVSIINDGTLQMNKSRIGFYGDAALRISGAFSPQFYNLEVFLDNNLYVETPLSISNSVDFFLGNIQTDRDAYTSLKWLQNATYQGAAQLSKVDGYAAVTDQNQFIFPIGDSQMLRPLSIEFNKDASFARSAYFYENPTIKLPHHITTGKEELERIGITEFWKLESEGRSKITIGWNERSNQADLTNDTNLLSIVGWDKGQNKWVNLGATVRLGNLSQGFITSDWILPNRYEAITFGVLKSSTSLVYDLDNYYLSPNGDGLNDSFVIPELEHFPENTLQIFDRNGYKVYDAVNYVDGFTGLSNSRNIRYKNEKRLTEGVYFYIISVTDPKLNFQGFLYLDN